MSQSVIMRFAPSPTGLLHIGNCRTALLTWLMNQSLHGKFILRIDDTDKTRSKIEYEDAIKRDLEWLGLVWNESFRQSDRLDLYLTAKDQLIKSGRLYPCYESQEELEIKRKNSLKRGLPPIYDRASLKLNAHEKNSLEKSGIQPHWRFLLNHEDIEWLDLIRGHMHFKSENITDPILFKADGSMTYTLASVVDDIECGITHIMRGEDHLTNSATHIQIFKALGINKIPQLAHLSLLSSKSGEISKRLGGFDIASLRNSGIEAMSINSFLAKIGTSDSIECKYTLKDLVMSFDIAKFSKAPTNYDYEELRKFNIKMIHNMSFEIFKSKLQYLPKINEQFWQAMHGNIDTLQDTEIWYKICFDNINTTTSDTALIQIALEVLPSKEYWNNSVWNIWIDNIKQKTNKRGKGLFLPLRLAITNQSSGPEMQLLLPIIGYDETKNRLLNCIR